jgi:hypothetical protein
MSKRSIHQTHRRRDGRYTEPTLGTTYVLHFTAPNTPSGTAARYRHAGHYIGWAADLEARLAEHRQGRGARLLRVIKDAGLGFTVAWIWPGTTKDREDQLKCRGSGARSCPECGIHPSTGQPYQPPAPAPGPERAPEYDFADWPDLTVTATTAQAAELVGMLRRGAHAAYKAATREWPTARDYDRAFDTALEVDGAAQRAAYEAIRFHGREPDERVQEWILRIRQETPAGQHQEEEMFRSKESVVQRRAEREASAEADRLFAIADELAKQTGELPNYQREITAERAARIRAQLGDDLARDVGVPAPATIPEGAALDAEIARLAAMYPETEELDNVPALAPRPDGTHADAIDSDIAAEQHRQPEAERWEYGPDAAKWTPALLGVGRDAPDHLYGPPECAEAGPETAHFGLQPGEPEDTGRSSAQAAPGGACASPGCDCDYGHPDRRPEPQHQAAPSGTFGHQMYSEMLQGLRQAGIEDARLAGQAQAEAG